MKNHTDYFQSLELVRYGVPNESADCVFVKWGDENIAMLKDGMENYFPSVPCWSIGALWQYLFEHNCDMTFTFDTEQSVEEMIEGLVNAAIIVRKREEE